MTGTVLYERDGHVAVLTLNRPDALNAVNSALADELGDHLERAVADAEVRAIVVTGAGRAFCAGADLSGRGGATFDYGPAGEDPQFHLKLGPGSLSDVEWTVQLLQLRNGVRAEGTLEALGALAGA